MSAPKSSMFDDNQNGERQQLRGAIEQEKEKFRQIAQIFYDAEQRTETQCIALTNAIVAAIDNVMSQGDWEESLFLKNTIKPLQHLRSEAIEVLQTLRREQGLEEIEEYRTEEHERKVYVSLYQADGHDMKKWALQLASIDRYIAGRPVYKNEQDVKNIIRQKLLQNSEAYVVVVVDASKILVNDFTSNKKDRNGFELLTIEQGVVKSADVKEFVHLGKRYHFYNQRLVAM